jgi:hypothetical protein
MVPCASPRVPMEHRPPGTPPARALAACLLLLLWARPAAAALEGPGVNQFLPAARTLQPPQIDGNLEDPAWAQAPVFDGFVQLFPQEGGAPSERTELRVLYDDSYVYFGFRCHATNPQDIVRGLGRRDSPPASDTVQVLLDPAHDHQTAYTFGVNAAGVQFDGLLLSDDTEVKDWDGVWDAATGTLPDGWTAELAIPLRLLRFPEGPQQIWGFAAQRHIGRTHEDLSSVLVPRNVAGKVSRLGHLAGMAQIRPQRNIELLPYLAMRTTLRSLSTAPDASRRLLPALDLGLDLRASITSNLALAATVNPDFGQVEADQLIQNLANVEPFFPEKRPFFLQGMDLFQPVGAQGGLAPQMLFYSRRIGLTTPILAAGKLTGTVGPGVDLAILDAVVTGPAVAEPPDPSRPKLSYAVTRPLHLGLTTDPLPAPPIPENTLIAIARGQPDPHLRLGAQLASAVPLTGACSAADAARPPAEQPVACQALGGNAAAVDGTLRTTDAEWIVLGQLTGSQVVAGPPQRILRDGQILRPGTTGLGTYLQAGKVGGEPFRFNMRYQRSSPTLELNATGFLPSQNQQYLGATATFTRPAGLGPLHSLDASLTAEGQWSTDGRLVDRGKGIRANVTALLPGFHLLSLEAGNYQPPYDIREITGTGIPFQRSGERYAQLLGESDRTRVLSGNLLAVVRKPLGIDTHGHWSWNADAGVIFRPQDSLETQLTLSVDDTYHGARWLDQLAPGRYLFGELHSRFFSLIFRQQLVFTPRLTLQAYAQLFTDVSHFGALLEGTSQDRATIRQRDLTPSDATGAPNFHGAALNLNLVARWEYRLGSTLYLVYTRSQEGRPFEDGQPVSSSLWPVRLSGGPAVDAFLLKWTYWWSI